MDVRISGQRAQATATAVASAAVLIAGLIAVPLHSKDRDTETVAEPTPSATAQPTPSAVATSSGPTSLVIRPKQLRQRVHLSFVRSGGKTADVTISIGAPTHVWARPILRASGSVALVGGSVCGANTITDAVIPVVLLLRNMTPDRTATIAWQWGVDGGADQSSTQPQFETAAPDQTFCAPSEQIPTSTLSFITDPLDPHQTHLAIGFVVIHHYYSKTKTHGDASRLQSVWLGLSGAPDDSSFRWQPTDATGPGLAADRAGHLFRIEVKLT